MKNLIAFFLLLLSTLLNSQEPTAKTFSAEISKKENPLKDDATAEKYGYRVYKKVCFTCHGSNGNGQGPQAAELANKPADFNHPVVKSRTDGELFWWISKGGNDMQPFSDLLTEEERWQVIAYIRSVQNQ